VSSEEALLRELYAAFNARDVDAVLARLHRDVDWPNGWEGGRLTGHDAVRAYWLRQWDEIDPRVTPVALTRRSDGRLAVTVHQVVRDTAGAVLSDRQVDHLYAFEDDLIRAMDIEP
jgi:hypothetical protein